MEDRLYERSDDISTERDVLISSLLKTGEDDELQAFLKEGEVLRLVNIELFKLINTFNSCYRQPKIQLVGLKSLEKDGLTKAEIFGESLDLEFLGVESKVHPVKVLFPPSGDGFIESFDNYDERKDKCHLYCLKLANSIPGECSVLTGFMYGYTNQTKYLHSVLRIDVGGKQGIIDPTINSLMTEEFYKKLTDFEVLTEVSSSTIKEDFDLLVKSQNVVLREYLLNRDGYVKELQDRQQSGAKESKPDNTSEIKK